MATFSHSQQTRTTASSNLTIPLYKTKERNNQLNILLQKFGIPFPIMLETYYLEKFLKETKQILLNSM